MITLEQPQNVVKTKSLSTPDYRSQVKQELRQQIHTTLQSAKDLPPQECLRKIEAGLLDIQAYCQRIAKTFIVVEQRITCDEYELGGDKHHTATLFRGPNDDASVAICVTDQGSLLHRNSCVWQVYRNAGDIRVTA